MGVQTIIRNTVNLDEPIKRKVLMDILGGEDNKAHRFEVELTQKGTAVSLKGAKVYGYFTRPDAVTVKLTGGVEGSVAYVVLNSNCYTLPGRISFAMKVELDGVTHTVLMYEGCVAATQGKGVVDDGYVIPSLTEWMQNIRKPNLLDNSDFRNPVNQRGSTEYAHGSSKYTIDRWLTVNGVKVNDGYITVFNGSPDTVYNFYQDFPLGVFDKSKTYTGAVKLLDGTVCVGSGVPVDGGTATLFNGKGFEIKLRKNYENNNKDRFYIQLPAGASLDIVWVALYEGAYTAETLPEYVPKGYAAELLECQRYYYQASNYVGFSGYKSSSTYFFIPLPTQMRITPTVTATSFHVRGSMDGEGGTENASVSAVDGDGAFGNMLRVTLTGDTKTNNQIITVVTRGLKISADL